MVLVLFFPGWSGNKNFDSLKEHLEVIPGVKVEIIEYLGIEGPFTKLRTRKSIRELADEAERSLLKIYFEDEKIIAVGHSLGAIILRLLIERGHKFEEVVFTGGPHKGFLPRFKIIGPLALLLKVKPYFELKPGSDFLKMLDLPPRGIYVASANDGVVSLASALPSRGERRFILLDCNHHMFPNETEKVSGSAIPIVAKIVEEYVNKSQ